MDELAHTDECRDRQFEFAITTARSMVANAPAAEANDLLDALARADHSTIERDGEKFRVTLEVRTDLTAEVGRLIAATRERLAEPASACCHDGQIEPVDDDWGRCVGCGAERVSISNRPALAALYSVGQKTVVAGERHDNETALQVVVAESTDLLSALDHALTMCGLLDVPEHVRPGCPRDPAPDAIEHVQRAAVKRGRTLTRREAIETIWPDWTKSKIDTELQRIAGLLSKRRTRA